VLPLELFYHSLLHIWLAGGVDIHLANSTSCKSSLMGVLRVANLVNCTHCPEAELCFYTGGRGCLTIVYTSYHMIYTQIRLAKMRKKQLILFYYKFQDKLCVLAMCVYWDTVTYLMAICKENHLNTMVSIYNYKQKSPYDTLFGGVK